MYELTFGAYGDGQWIMTRSYPVGPDETGSEHYRNVKDRPSEVVKITGTWEDKNGREIATGTVIMNGVGIGYAWPVR